MDKKESKSENIANGLKNIFEALMSNSLEEAKQHLIYSLLLETPDLLKDPRILSVKLLNPQKRAIQAALTQIKELPQETAHEYSDIFINNSFYKSHLEALFTSFEGNFACADKSNVVLGRYLRKLISGDPGTWEIDDETCYWLPRFGTQDDWYNLIEALYEFRMGKNEKYFFAYKKLLELGEQKKKAQ